VTSAAAPKRHKGHPLTLSPPRLSHRHFRNKIGTQRRFAVRHKFGSDRREADMPRASGPCGSDQNDPGCVKTHTVAKCRKNNSPGRHHASRVQYDLTLRYAIPSRSFYARCKGWSFHTAKTHSGHRSDRNPARQQSPGPCLSLIVAAHCVLDPAPQSLLLALAIALPLRQKTAWHRGLWPAKPFGRNARPFDEIALLWNSRDLAPRVSR
jgi:hypothetical protein